MANLHLAIVDLRDLTSTDAARKEAAQQTLGEALETWGFVAITHHGIDGDLLARTYDTARQLFERVDETPRYERPRDGFQRGYTGFGRERAKDAVTPDIKEFWQVGRPLPADHPLIASGKMPANVFPDLLPAFGEATDSLFAAMDQVANTLLFSIATFLGLDANALVDACAEGNSVLRVIHYPPIGPDAPEGAVRSAAHEDINLLTILPTSTEPGLELLDKADGSWRALQTPPGSVICDTGDIMQRLTGGRLRSTTHRVVNPPGTRNVARYSLPFFCHPRPDWLIVPTQGDEPPISAGRFLRERLSANGLLPRAS